MKYEELHKRIRKAGWELVRTSGSHRIYEKNGRTYPVPFHGGEGSRKRTCFKSDKGNGLVEIKPKIITSAFSEFRYAKLK